MAEDFRNIIQLAGARCNQQSSPSPHPPARRRVLTEATGLETLALAWALKRMKGKKKPKKQEKVPADKTKTGRHKAVIKSLMPPGTSWLIQ